MWLTDYVGERYSGASEIQFQIPQGFVESDEEDELYEEVEDIPETYIVSPSHFSSLFPPCRVPF